MHEDIAGQVSAVWYRNEVTGWTGITFMPEGIAVPISAVGILPVVSVGEHLRLSGTWQQSTKYGKQFHFDQYRSILPVTTHGIERYLSSGLFPGIGPATAKKLVGQLGIDTIHIIDEKPEELAKVKGLGKKRIELIGIAWKKHKGQRDIMVFLQSHGVSPSIAMKIIRKFGDKAGEVVYRNPYRLIEDISGVGFKTADKIAQELGFEPSSPIRIRGALLYLLQSAQEEGHTYLPKSLLINRIRDLIGISEGEANHVLKMLGDERSIIQEDPIEPADDIAVYLPALYHCEISIANMLIRLINKPSPVQNIESEKAIKWFERVHQMHLGRDQMEALRQIFRQKVVVLTGGPGTGKTTIIRAILDVYDKIKRTFLICAPTGRAAKKLAESTGRDARTIHRLLEFSPRDHRFTFNRDNRLPLDGLVVDECSMVDVYLFNALIQAIPDMAHLIIVGDADQLPSVGPGSVLRDLIDSQAIPVARLNEIFRQKERSLITENAHRVHRGEMPQLPSPTQNLQDFYFIECPDPRKIIDTIQRLILDRIPARLRCDAMKDIQVLTPMIKGELGFENMNQVLQALLNPHGEPFPDENGKFRIGDKVMQVRNNYQKDVFNGDLGYIKGYNKSENTVVIDFDDRLVGYDFSELDDIMPAYAITVHKAQGSEYPAVILPLHTQHFIMLQRNLLYTAITRGRMLVVIVGTKEALKRAIKNDTINKRYGSLSRRLKSTIHLEKKADM